MSPNHLVDGRDFESEHTAKDHYRANSQINQATNRVRGQPSFLCSRQSQIESFDSCDSREYAYKIFEKSIATVYMVRGSGAVTVWKGIESAACEERWH